MMKSPDILVKGRCLKKRDEFELRINCIEKMVERDQEFLEFIVKSIVDNPEAVKIERNIDERGVLITLSVDPKDMGMVIGREGTTAKAIRTLLRVVGARNNARVNLKINEPEGSVRGTSEPKESEKSIDDIVNDIK